MTYTVIDVFYIIYFLVRGCRNVLRKHRLFYCTESNIVMIKYLLLFLLNIFWSNCLHINIFKFLLILITQISWYILYYRSEESKNLGKSLKKLKTAYSGTSVVRPRPGLSYCCTVRKFNLWRYCWAFVTTFSTISL